MSFFEAKKSDFVRAYSQQVALFSAKRDFKNPN